MGGFVAKMNSWVKIDLWVKMYLWVKLDSCVMMKLWVKMKVGFVGKHRFVAKIDL